LATPYRDVIGITLVVSYILAKHDEVCDKVDGAIAVATSYGKARRVVGVCSIVKLVYIALYILATLPYKVEKTPHGDRWVVVVLIYYILKLLYAISLKLCRWIVADIREGDG
jgi:hypothetical protein